MPNLANCPRCGNLFVKAFRTVCDKCHKDHEKMFDTVYNFIRKRENRMATMTEVVEATGVEEYIVAQFIREGRLKISLFPNLTYPCQSCGQHIKQGKICTKCQKGIHSDLSMMSAEKEVEEKRKEQERQRALKQTYTTLDERLEGK